jgi:hypothetical protein
MHQLIAQAEIVKAGAALLWINRKLVQGPGRCVCLWLAPTPAPFIAPVAATIAVMPGRGSGFVRRLMPGWGAVA